MLLTVVCLLAVSCSNDEDGQVNAQTTMKTGKTLVVYYSYTGNSRDIVTSLTSQIEADVLEIQPAQKGLKYEAMLLEKGPIEVPGYDELRTQAIHARELAEADGAPKCLTHNDFFNLNLLYGEDGTLSLIDWEYAGMSDFASDYGTFVVTCMLDDAEAERALELYYGRKPTLEEKRHNFVFVGLAGWCWYIWSLQKESEGDFVGEWLYIYYKYAKKYLPLAISLYEKQ